MRNARIGPTRSQPVGVRIDLPADIGAVFATVGFDSRFLVPADLRQEGTLGVPFFICALLYCALLHLRPFRGGSRADSGEPGQSADVTDCELACNDNNSHL